MRVSGERQVRVQGFVDELQGALITSSNYVLRRRIHVCTDNV